MDVVPVIVTHVEKLSDDNCIVPVQSVLVEFTVNEEASIKSENVMAIELLSEIPVLPSVGEVDETVGAVVSSLSAYDSKLGIVADMPRLL